MLSLLLVDEILLPRHVKWPTNRRGLPLRKELNFICVSAEANASSCFLPAMLRQVNLQEVLDNLRSLHLS